MFILWALGTIVSIPAVVFTEAEFSVNGDGIVSGPRFVLTTLLWPVALPFYLWRLSKQQKRIQNKATLTELQPHLDEIEEYLRRS